MKASQTYQCIVKFGGASSWTSTIRKQCVTCAWGGRVAASRLAERSFGENSACITCMLVQVGDHEERIKSRWPLSCRNPKEIAYDT